MRTQCQFTVKRSEKRVGLTVAAEQQPCSVQVVEWVGLVASGFQFLLGLAAVFAEEFKEAIKTLLKVFLLLFVFSAILMYGCGIDRETLEQFPDP